MDWDKDGILGKEDLRATWDKVGKLVTDPELDSMLGEASGPVNFTQLLTLFAARMSDGGLWIINVYNLFKYVLILLSFYVLFYRSNRRRRDRYCRHQIIRRRWQNRQWKVNFYIIYTCISGDLSVILTSYYFYRLRYGLLNWGDKFSTQEVKDAFDNMEIDKKGMIDTEDLISMVLGSGDDD